MCGRCGGMAMKKLCAFGLVEAVCFLWDLSFRWTSSSQSTLCWKWESLRHRMVLLWVWSGSSHVEEVRELIEVQAGAKLLFLPLIHLT